MADVIDLLYSSCFNRGFYREPEDIKGKHEEKLALNSIMFKE